MTVLLLTLVTVQTLTAIGPVQGIVTGKAVSLPHTRYVFEGQEGILRCQNRSENDSVFYNNIDDAQWYRLFPNGTTHQFGTSGPVFIQRHGLYFHPFVRPEDQGMYYCCKPNGPCSESSNVTIAVPPTIIAVKPEYVSSTGSNVTLACQITYHGRPAAKFGWRKRGLWLPDDLVSINRTHLSLTLSNLSDSDAGSYRCAAQGVLSFFTQIINLMINAPPEVAIQGPTEANFGSTVSLKCIIVKGYPSPTVFIITPQGEVVNGSMITFNATMNHAGYYTCVANNSLGTVTRNLSLTVNVAPQPVKSRQWVTITAGADLILPCNIEMAYPPPVFHWQHIMPHEDEIAKNVQPLKNGSLLLTGVKAPAIYKCTAWNEYGTSIQFIYIMIDHDNQEYVNSTLIFLITDPNGNCFHNRSENFKAEISTKLEVYIQDICDCTVTLTNANLICINATSALYTIQLTNQNSTLSTFLYELLNVLIMNNGINLDIAIIRTWTVMEEYSDNSSNKNPSSDWKFYLLLTTLFTLLACFISYSYYRYVKNKCVKDHKQDKEKTLQATSAVIVENKEADKYDNTWQSADDQPAMLPSVTTNNVTTV